MLSQKKFPNKNILPNGDAVMPVMVMQSSFIPWDPFLRKNSGHESLSTQAMHH